MEIRFPIQAEQLASWQQANVRKRLVEVVVTKYGDVAKLLGHANVTVTMRYAHFAPEAGRAAMDALGKALARGA